MNDRSDEPQKKLNQTYRIPGVSNSFIAQFTVLVSFVLWSLPSLGDNGSQEDHGGSVSLWRCLESCRLSTLVDYDNQSGTSASLVQCLETRQPENVFVRDELLSVSFLLSLIGFADVRITMLCF